MRIASLVTIALSLGLPAPLLAQGGYATEGATLDTWAQNTWLLAADREASGGRLSERGVLARFHIRIDRMYLLDRIALPFDPWEDREWGLRENGVRFWTGSITIREMIEGSHVKAGAPLGGRWSARVDLYQEQTPALDRHLLQLGFHKETRRGVFGFLQGTLQRSKVNADVEVGAGWRRGRTEVSVSLTAMDAFSDVVYQVLSKGQGYADTAWDYTAHPFGLRTHFDVPLASGVRFEANTGHVTPTSLRVYPDLFPDSGYFQHENFDMASGLLETKVSKGVRLGAFGTWVRSSIVRVPRFSDTPAQDFRLIEGTSQAGLMVLAQPSRKLVFKTWATRTWRTESRTYRPVPFAPPVLPNVDYEDHNWSGQIGASYGPGAAGSSPGLRLDAAFEFLRLDVGRGDGQVPLQWLTNTNHTSRMRLNFAWRFKGGSNLLMGYRFHFLDSWTTGRIFDGIQARFALYW
jgi:hypothetical protein